MANNELRQIHKSSTYVWQGDIDVHTKWQKDGLEQITTSMIISEWNVLHVIWWHFSYVIFGHFLFIEFIIFILTSWVIRVVFLITIIWKKEIIVCKSKDKLKIWNSCCLWERLQPIWWNHIEKAWFCSFFVLLVSLYSYSLFFYVFFPLTFM